MVIYLGLFRGKKICTSLKNLHINYDAGMKELKEELGKDTKASWELYTNQTNKQTNNSVDLTMQAQRRQVKQLNHKANQNNGEHEEAK